MCRLFINLDLSFTNRLVEFMNFSKKLCPITYPADTMVNKIIPATEVLNSTKKFATVASTLAKISSPTRIDINKKTRWSDVIKEKKRVSHNHSSSSEVSITGCRT